MSRALSGLAVVGLVLLLAAAPAQATFVDDSGQQIEPGTDSDAVGTQTAENSTDASARDRVRVVITFVNSDARDEASLPTAHEGVDITGGYDVDFMPVLFASVPEATLPELRERSDVESVTIDTEVQSPEPVSTASTGGDPAGSTQSQSTPWAIKRIGAPDAQQRTDDSAESDVDVAVLDSGIDYDHPDLDDNVVWGANFSEGSNDYTLASADDNNRHGTNAAGIIAAEDNNRGVVGIVPNADLYAIKVMNSTGIGYYSWWIKGIDAALEGPDGTIGTADDADVISMSIGGASDASKLQNAVSDANDHAMVVASAGNSGDGDPATNEVGYPAKYSDAIAVAATDRSDSTTTWSSEGKEVELAAPGSGQYTTDAGGGTYYFGGTSAAAPHVAGAAALIIAKDLEDGSRDLSDKTIRQRLQNTATDIESSGRDKKSGYGLIQVDKALTSGNGAPTADAGSDTSVTAGSMVVLDASGSSDPDGDSLTYSWSQTGGTSVSLSDSGTATPEFTAPSVSTQEALTFEVTVDDGNGGSDTDSVSVTVSPGNSAPNADAGSGKSVAAGDSVTLDSSGSSDPDGDPIKYSWSQTGGTSVSLNDASTETPEFTAPSVGSQETLTFEVEVTDSNGASDTDSVSVTVSPSNSAPTADAGSDTTTSSGSTVALDGGGSSDPDGDSLSYSWVQTGGPSVTLTDAGTTTPEFTAPSVSNQETLTFEVTVTDTSGASDTDSTSVTVSPGNSAPNADAGSDVSVTAGSPVELDSSGSSDPDGDPIKYSWSQTRGASVSLSDASTETPEFTAPTVSSQETLTFEVEVTDTDGASDTDSVSVTVSPSNSAPTADAGTNTTVQSGTTITLDGTGSSDPDGDSLTYSWSQVVGSALSLSDAGTSTPTFTAPSVNSNTTLTFELTVQDGMASSTDTVSVTVVPAKQSPSRFDLDNDGTVDRSDVLDIIAAYNTNSTVGGQPIAAADVMAAISEYNS